jgi:hypothetical protein
MHQEREAHHPARPLHPVRPLHSPKGATLSWPHPQVKILDQSANCLVLTKVDADLAPSAEQSKPRGRLVLPIFIRRGGRRP